MYSCGPTVYAYQHIGNLRAYVFADTLRRVLEWKGYPVIQVVSITDVGHLTSDMDEGADKLELASEREHRSVWDIAAYYTDIFMHDREGLRIRHIADPDRWTVDRRRAVGLSALTMCDFAWRLMLDLQRIVIEEEIG